MRIGSHRWGALAWCGVVLITLGAAGQRASASSPSTGGTSGTSTAPKWGIPDRLPTFGACGGYEPGIAIDKYGNIYVTAHKQNQCDAVATDPNAPPGVRSQSWMWTSSDGVNFVDMPNLAVAGPDQQDFGDEGDIALDDASHPHLFFVDTKVVDDSITRWTISGLGTNNMVEDMHRPAIPTLMPVDDRPWVIAQGASTVMFAGNEGDKDTYNAGTPSLGCSGAGTPPPMSGPGHPAAGGRYTVYMSHDGGTTFDPVGCTLPGSGWCRPAADHSPGSHYLYMFCTNDAGADDNVNNPGDPGYRVGTLYSFVSADGGTTWKRYTVDNYNSNLPSGSNTNGDVTWPAVNVAKNGDVYALFANPQSNSSQVKTGTILNLYKSTDHGKTWSRQNVTPPNAGLIRYSWMNISPDGHTVGVAYFTHQTLNGNWHVYGGWTPRFGTPVKYSLVDTTEVAPAGDFAFGDFFEVAFDPQNRLDVVYTRCTDLVAGNATTDCDNSDIYFNRTTTAAPSGGGGGGGGGGGECHEGDGDGDIHGAKGGTASFHMDEDKCEDDDDDHVDTTDASAGHTFHSTQISQVLFDDAARNVTVSGTGTDNGKPVSFVATAVDNRSTTLDTFAIALSDGYHNAGALLDGSIDLTSAAAPSGTATAPVAS